MKKSLLIIGLLFLVLLEISKVYFIMPFPGSQQADTLTFAYFINNNIWWLRLILLAVVVYPLWHYISKGKRWQKILIISVVALYALIFTAVNFFFLADKMFFQPKQKLFASAASDTTDKNKLVIGVVLDGEAKAYPIEIIGYHHQVRDTIGKQSVIVTYCTVCRSGRVFSPFVNGKYEHFRLVGMDHYNAMFEDATTKSWWQQATGKAITGKLKGTQLVEIPSKQMQLSDWIAIHPNSMILQPDHNYQKEYADLKGFDEGTLKSSLEKRDSGSWKMKSWVVGVVINNKSRAYDWSALVNKRMIEDSVGPTSILISIAPNNKTFYVMNRNVGGKNLHFTYDVKNELLQDIETHSTWNINGHCIDGEMKGKQLQFLQSYQEFWHSWQTFHPDGEHYK